MIDLIKKATELSIAKKNAKIAVAKAVAARDAAFKANSIVHALESIATDHDNNNSIFVCVKLAAMNAAMEAMDEATIAKTEAVKAKAILAKIAAEKAAEKAVSVTKTETD